jgi:Undecaprenyl-phosphate galactose phosphotransferase WbaP
MSNVLQESKLKSEEFERFLQVKQRLQRAPFLMTISLFVSDLLAVVLSLTIALVVKNFVSPVADFEAYFQMWPILILISVTFILFGLYPAIGLSPAKELRLLTYTLSLVFISLAALTFIIRGGWQFSRWIFALSWGFSLILVPIARLITRSLGAKSRYWGIPVVILTDTKKGQGLTQYLMGNRKVGFYPVAVLTEDGAENGLDILYGPWSLAPSLAQEHGLRHAILTMPLLSSTQLSDVIEKYCADYLHLLVVPSFLSGLHLWVTPRDLGGNLSLEVMQNLLSPTSQSLKRAFDIVTSLAIILVLSPIFIFISIAIIIDSRGSVFYVQDRVGKGDTIFSMIKFRTMVPDAKERLAQHLEENEAIKDEWEKHQKLVDDPRITRVGALLRRWSLDELPQLFNVLRGEMSLVGPRPMMTDQEAVDGREYSFYTRVAPGLTGLWQVSGRSSTTFRHRARMDSYYVRNWSLWLDLYILAKTPIAVLRGEGAF